MEFALRGFTPDTGFRVFAFDGVAGDRRQTGFTVRTDLSLARKYGISLQDLPLLCRALLEQRVGDEDRALTFTEDQMRRHAGIREAELAEARNKRASRRIQAARPARPGAFGSHDPAAHAAAAGASVGQSDWQKK